MYVMLIKPVLHLQAVSFHPLYKKADKLAVEDIMKSWIFKSTARFANEEKRQAQAAQQ